MSPQDNEVTTAGSVSIVIPHYGDPALALALVDDLKAQQTTSRLEIIVVDDCSPQAFPATPDLTVLRRETNGGFGAAVNTGARVASGRWLMIANSDLRVRQDFVEQLLDESASLMPALVGPASRRSDGTREPTGRRFPSSVELFVSTALPLQAFHRRAWFQRLTGRVAPRGQAPVAVDWVQGSLMLLPLELFLQVGGFDEDYFMYSEEVDLQRRLQDLGINRWLLPRVEVTHAGGGSTRGTKIGDRMMRSRLIYARKWGTERAVRRVLASTAILNLAYRLLLRGAGQQTSPRHAWRREWQRARQSLSTHQSTGAST